MFLLISYLSLSLFYILLVIQFCIEREGFCPVLPDSQGRTWCSLPRQRSCGGLWGLWPELRLFRAWELYSGRRRVKPGSGDRNWVFRCFHHFSLLYFYSWTVHFQSLLCGGQDDVSMEDCSVDICLWDALILNIKESSDTSNNEGLKEQVAWTCIWTAPSLQFVSYGCLLLRTRGARMLELIGFLVSFPNFESLRPKQAEVFQQAIDQWDAFMCHEGMSGCPYKHTKAHLYGAWCPSMGSKPTCEPGSIKSRGKATKSRRTGSWALGAPGSVGEIWVGRIAWVESALKFGKWKFGSRMYQT